MLAQRVMAYPTQAQHLCQKRFTCFRPQNLIAGFMSFTRKNAWVVGAFCIRPYVVNVVPTAQISTY